MSGPGRRWRPRTTEGFTLTELLVALVLGGLVLAATSDIMISQAKSYANQRARTDVSETLRTGSGLLAWELRHAGVGNGLLTIVDSQSVALRSVQGVGVICAKDAALRSYGLWKTSGDIKATADDSALIYHSGTQTWRAVKISQVSAPTSVNVPTCTWAGHANPPGIVMQVTVTSPADTEGVYVGGAVRTFRSVRYGEYQSADGRWWLGRKVGAGGYEQFTGPLLAPASPASAGGLSFAYYDTLGVLMTFPANLGAVGTVRVGLRAKSYKTYRNLNTGGLGYRLDSLATKVTLRR